MPYYTTYVIYKIRKLCYIVYVKNKKMPEKIIPKIQRVKEAESNDELNKIGNIKAHLFEVGLFQKKIEDVLISKEHTPFVVELNSVLSKDFQFFSAALKQVKEKFIELLRTNTKIIPAQFLKALFTLNEMKKAIETKYNNIEKKHRIIEERKAKAEYKETPIEGIKFRQWNQSDVEGFSKFVSTNATSEELLNKLLKNNTYLWNPKGNPELYYQEQCVEVGIMLLIHYCFRNKINLALPASDKFLVLSKFKTIEQFMSALYPQLSASHLFSGAGGIVAEIPKNQVKPGDIYTARHLPPASGFHVQMVVKNSNGKLEYLTGDQINKDFRMNPEKRAEVEKTYPLGFVDAQLNSKPENIKMRYGGYALKPRIKSSTEASILSLGGTMSPKDEIKFYRINPKRINEVIKGITG